MEPKKENRQNTPSEIMREKQEFRLALRKKKIEEVIWAQRYPINPIKVTNSLNTLVATISKKDAGYVEHTTT